MTPPEPLMTHSQSATAVDPTAVDPIAVDTVAAGREILDAIDTDLLALLVQRRAVSREVQQLRVDAGGSRVEHSRENAIIRRWADELGDGGAELALAMLAHCRGRR
jgi:chorismate mutase